MSNWKPHADYSHPNWTGRTTSQCKRPMRTREKEPPILAQVALGVLVAVAFMAGMFAL